MTLTLRKGDGWFNVTNSPMPTARRTLEELISHARTQAAKQCRNNEPFRLELWDSIDLGPNPKGGERRVRKVVFWKAAPITDDLLSRGYSESFPDGHHDMEMPEGERPVPKDHPHRMRDVFLDQSIYA